MRAGADSRPGLRRAAQAAQDLPQQAAGVAHGALPRRAGLAAAPDLVRLWGERAGAGGGGAPAGVPDAGAVVEEEEEEEEVEEDADAE